MKSQNKWRRKGCLYLSPNATTRAFKCEHPACSNQDRNCTYDACPIKDSRSA